jgi:surface antigen
MGFLFFNFMGAYPFSQMHIKTIVILHTICYFSCFPKDEKQKKEPMDTVSSNPQQIAIQPGDSIDVHNGVVIYYNGGEFHGDHWVGNYKLGQKYQCVEFVKRYYFYHLDHKMPNMWGHAVNFFNKNLKDGARNADRGLIQYSNPSMQKPKPDDLIVYDLGDAYGHVSIVSEVNGNMIEIVQQNWGSTSRNTFQLTQADGMWRIENQQILGWLRNEVSKIHTDLVAINPMAFM